MLPLMDAGERAPKIKAGQKLAKSFRRRVFYGWPLIEIPVQPHCQKPLKSN